MNVAVLTSIISTRMHENYENRNNRRADFRVKYKFRSPAEGGRRTGEPVQGIRCDWSYGDEVDNLYMIWPEFEDENGNVLLDNERPVPNSGTARMWILNIEMRAYH